MTQRNGGKGCSQRSNEMQWTEEKERWLHLYPITALSPSLCHYCLCESSSLSLSPHCRPKAHKKKSVLRPRRVSPSCHGRVSVLKTPLRPFLHRYHRRSFSRIPLLLFQVLLHLHLCLIFVYRTQKPARMPLLSTVLVLFFSIAKLALSSPV